jgi:hypothetical protein
MLGGSWRKADPNVDELHAGRHMNPQSVIHVHPAFPIAVERIALLIHSALGETVVFAA